MHVTINPIHLRLKLHHFASLQILDYKIENMLQFKQTYNCLQLSFVKATPTIVGEAFIFYL